MSLHLMFGLLLSPLYAAIADVESDNGRTSDNVYQITREYSEDLSRLYPSMGFSYDDALDPFRSREMMYCYWRHYAYAYSRETGMPVTYEVLAKMHHRGGRYWKRGDAVLRQAERYWQKVRLRMGVVR